MFNANFSIISTVSRNVDHFWLFYVMFHFCWSLHFF